MFGIDVFRAYQTVTDWKAVADHGVRFVWVKATNGPRIATFNNGTPAPADPVVAGARSVGVAPGLYHYALAGDPLAQADVFAGEVLRLGCHGPGVLPPALDLEETAIAGPRGFAVAFLARLQQRIGQQRVAFYSAASWMARLLPDTWGVPGLVVWTAAYGPNDGAVHPIAQYSTYRGRTDIQQYSSAGSCPGITSSGLDMNESLIPLDQLLGLAPTDGEDDTVIVKCDYPNANGTGTAEVTAIYSGGYLSGVDGDTAKSIDTDIAAGKVFPRWVAPREWDDLNSKGNQLLVLILQLIAAVKAIPAGGGSGLTSAQLIDAVQAGVANMRGNTTWSAGA